MDALRRGYPPTTTATKQDVVSALTVLREAMFKKLDIYENLSGYDQDPEESLYFLQIRPVIEEFSYELFDLGVIPPFFEIEFGIEIPTEARLIELIERGRYQKWEALSPIEGAIADLLVVVKDREIKKLISYQIYRLE